MKFLVALACSFIAVAYGASYNVVREPLPSSTDGGDDGGDDWAPAVYNFAWSVDDAESYVYTSHKENRNGDNTEGEYTIVEPDGSTRKVTYTVNGDSGFIAHVNGVRWPQEAPAAPAGGSGLSVASRPKVDRVVKYVRVVPAAPAPAPAPRPVQDTRRVVYLVAAPAQQVQVSAPAAQLQQSIVLKETAVASAGSGAAEAGSSSSEEEEVAPAPAPAPAVSKPSGGTASVATGTSSVLIQTPSHTVSY